jgi:hypothetical protein
MDFRSRSRTSEVNQCGDEWTSEVEAGLRKSISLWKTRRARGALPARRVAPMAIETIPEFLERIARRSASTALQMRVGFSTFHGISQPVARTSARFAQARLQPPLASPFLLLSSS